MPCLLGLLYRDDKAETRLDAAQRTLRPPFVLYLGALLPGAYNTGPGVRTWKEVFLGLLGETFVVVSEDRKKRVRIKLFDVYDIYETAETEQFSLVFRAPLGVKLPKGMYSIRHRDVGKTILYLQPSGADEFNRYYEAPFNLLP